MRLALGLTRKQPTPLKTKTPTKMESEGQGADSPEQKSPLFIFFASAFLIYFPYYFRRFLRGRDRSEALPA